MNPAVRAAAGRVEWAVASAAIAGESQSGDAHVVRSVGPRVLLAVLDGLGHGAEAAAAAQLAVHSLETAIAVSVITLVRDCHQALRGTRGVVMNLACFDAGEETLSWMGIGNVAGVLFRADTTAVPRRESILQRGGLVGARLPLLRASVTAIRPGDVLVFATDGVDPGFAFRHPIAGEPAARLAERILTVHGRDTDDALVMVARFRRGDGWL